MTDDRIIEYLRARGGERPPAEFVSSVMAVIDASLEPRSRFSAFLPAFISAGAVALVALVAILIGPGRDIGPAPSPSGTPAPTTTSATFVELENAVRAATERLAAAPAVEGTHTYTIGGYLASASWFDWRPSGDAVVVTRTDLDVSAPWWTDPAGEPLSVGERIDTDMWVIAGDTAYASREETWLVLNRDDAPRVPQWGIGMLSGEVPPVGGIDRLSERAIHRRALLNGAELWVLETRRDDERSVTEWRIGPDGALSSVTITGDSPALAPGLQAPASARAVIELTPIEDPDPIPTPDPDAVPDPTLLGLPADFPLAGPKVASPPPGEPLITDDPECAHPSGAYRVTLPEGWWTNRGSADDEPLWDACELFGPEPFPDTPSADRNWPDGVTLTIGWIDGGCIGSFLALRSSDETTIDGRTASMNEYAWGTEPDDPPRLYQYVIDLSEPGIDCEVGGRFITAATSTQMTGDYEENKAFLDQIMEGMQITPP